MSVYIFSFYMFCEVPPFANVVFEQYSTVNCSIDTGSPNFGSPLIQQLAIASYQPMAAGVAVGSIGDALKRSMKGTEQAYETFAEVRHFQARFVSH